MPYAMPTHCPVCGQGLHVTGLTCPNCHTTVAGEFAPNEFALLPPEHLEFMRLFIKARGNLKEVERILGLSYPTVRLRFENMLRALGYEAQPVELGTERSEVLALLEKGEISAEEAAERLRALKKRR
jgi:hypothetical protein